MKRMAMAGSRKMSNYGRGVINKLLVESCRLGAEEIEIVTIRVSGCNSEVIRKSQEIGLRIKVLTGENFQKLNDEISDYADFLVVIEGGRESGTILLAKNFLDKGKMVCCVPGRIDDEGSWATNWLIKQGATPLIGEGDLTEVLQ